MKYQNSEINSSFTVTCCGNLHNFIFVQKLICCHSCTFNLGDRVVTFTLVIVTVSVFLSMVSFGVVKVTSQIPKAYGFNPSFDLFCSLQTFHQHKLIARHFPALIEDFSAKLRYLTVKNLMKFRSIVLNAVSNQCALGKLLKGFI